MTNQKLKRIRSKPITNIDRARARAARQAAKRKRMTIAEGMRHLDAAHTPEFLKVREPDDRCEEYRVPPPFRQPDIVPEASGILYAKRARNYAERYGTPRDSSRVGFLLCVLSACIVAALIKVVL